MTCNVTQLLQNTLYVTLSFDPRRSLDPEVENHWSKLTPTGSTEWPEVRMARSDDVHIGSFV